MIGGKKHIFYLVLALLLSFGFQIQAQSGETGIPIVRNFFPADYNGHTQNFDVTEDSVGNIYIANFAGVLVFNGSDWTRIVTPDISRVTQLESDSEGNIYAGGLNEIGMLKSTESGNLYYQDFKELTPKKYQGRFGEVKKIITTKNQCLFFTREYILIYDGNDIQVKELQNKVNAVFSFGENILLKGEGNTYRLYNPEKREIEKSEIFKDYQITAVTALTNGEFVMGSDRGLLFYYNQFISSSYEDLSPLNAKLKEAKISSILSIDDNLLAVGTLRGGVFFVGREGNEVTAVNRTHGLQNDYVNQLFRDKGNRLWVALNNGISVIGYPWPWTMFNRSNGLKSGVISITRNKGILYAGTYQGLYQLNASSGEFESIEGIETGCWQFVKRDNHLFGATSEGLYRIENNQVVQLTNEFTLSLTMDQNDQNILFAGTLDGFRKVVLSTDGNLVESELKHQELGEVTKLLTDDKGFLWLSTMNGQLAKYDINSDGLQLLGTEQNLPSLTGNQFYKFNSTIVVSTTSGLMSYDYASSKFQVFEMKTDSSNGALNWPGLVFTDGANSVWMTKGDETGLSLYEKEDGLWKYKKQASGPFQDFVCRSMFKDENGANWFGGPSGLIRYDKEIAKSLLNQVEVYISEIQLNNDSTLYGGFGEKSLFNSSTNLSHKYRDVSFKFASTGYNVQSEVSYSYKLKGSSNIWSDWNTTSNKEYQKLSPGNYTFLLKAKDVYGNISSVKEFRFEVRYPWYQKWYMVLIYILLLSFVIWQIVQLRLRNLVKEKQKLENTVKERTSEVIKQRDEIQEKSEELTHALSDLKNTQEELIRQEKLASVGQMTKGIVDRIINPLNYINNFSSLSKDLANELKEVMEDEKESISEDGYEEILDISSMLELNLGKIKDHGDSSVRIVKGMEELLKDRTGKFTETNLVELVTQIIKRINNSFEKEITELGIEVDLRVEGDDFETKIVTEELTKAVFELFDNAMQSVITSSEKNKSIGAHVIGELSSTKDEIVLKVVDNGMGIPEKEIGQIYDPFFTTKPTAKGSGVGLYLVREIIYLHKGSIEAKSEVGSKTTFTVKLPKSK